MLEVNLQFIDHLGEKGDMALDRVHHKFKGDDLGLDQVGKRLFGDQLFTNGCWRQHAVVVRTA